ncbi:MAG: sensor histidine kinase, partial [Syntrophothermus sp.]
IFFHDVLNTAGGLKGIIDLIADPEYNKKDELLAMLPKVAGRLIDEISAQREITAAENNELVINSTLLNSVSIINDVAEIYLNHQIIREKLICVDQNAVPVDFICDRTVIMRVIGNMVKNALEATKNGGVVTISCKAAEEMVEFSVHNDSFMPENVQLQIFQRSFSTKAKDRGLGTYSMKLLSERYLNGKVRFNSTESMGTTFYVRVPINYLP